MGPNNVLTYFFVHVVVIVANLGFRSVSPFDYPYY